MNELRIVFVDASQRHAAGPDGVHMVIPSEADRRPGETDLEQINRCGDRIGLPSVGRIIVANGSLPRRNGARMFSLAWRLVNGVVQVDQTIARNLVRDKVSKESASLLKEAQIKGLEVGEAGTPQQRAVQAQYRGALRAAMNTQLAALETMTLEELHDFVPTWPQAPA